MVLGLVQKSGFSRNIQLLSPRILTSRVLAYNNQKHTVMTSTRPADTSADAEEIIAKKIKVDEETSQPILATEVSSTSTTETIESNNVVPPKFSTTPYSAPNAGISELDVGITQFLSPELKGFKGILKQRYTDFLVNEIDTEGNVVHLVDVGFQDKRDRRKERREVVREDETNAEEGSDQAPKREQFTLSSENREKLVELLGEKTVDEMVALLTNGSKVLTETPVDEKEDRTRIHQLVREAFESRLETRTTPENTFIVTLSSGANKFKSRGDRMGKDSIGAQNAKLGPQKNYVHFTLYKENQETMQIANLLTKFLRIPPKTITYAGTKDRRGVTVQRASVGKMKVERLNGMNRTLKNVKLGGFKYEDEPLKLGDLNGNEFHITIRNVDESNEQVINAAMTSLREKGYINYFGLQRFGTFSVSTHTIGTHVLKSDWETTCQLLLSPQALSIPESVEARKVWEETQDAKKTLKLMPRKCVAECSILNVLAQSPNSYANAIMKIPRNLRMMYGHAYQSYIWNCVASERIKKFGIQIIEGDLVLMDEDEKNKAAESASQSKSEETLEEDIRQDIFVRARPVTKEEIEAGTKTIFDVVLPTPGFDIRYPANDLKQVYVNEMKKDGLDPEDMRRNIREFSLAGSYRHLISKPNLVEWAIRKYEDDTEQMVKTDLDLLNEGLSEEERITKSEGTGSKLAIILKIQLGASQYATMALREVMKVDTKRRGEIFDVQISAPKE